MKQFPTIYKRTSKGQIQSWQIFSGKTSYHTEEGIVGGTISINKPHSVEPKNVGKANETTQEQQAEIEAQAKWEKKLKTGYTLNIKDIDKITFQKPMKGYKWNEQSKKAKPPFDIQDKLNGIRYQAEADASRSTGGEQFHTTPHIREDIAPMFKDYPELFLDGEGYNKEWGYNKQLNRLTKLLNVTIGEKDLTPELLEDSRKHVQFWLFDAYGFEGITKTTPWRQRHAALKKLLKKYDLKYVHLLDYETVNSVKELFAKLEENRIAGGEGLMVRWGDCPRKEGKSTQMLKLKHFEDDEFKIVAFEEGNGAYAGCVKAVILELHEPSTRGETTFRSNIDGDIEWLRELWVNQKKYIGELATTEFQHYSEYGIPQLPYVRAVRNYEKIKK